MPVVAILRDTLWRIEASDDARKNGPIIAKLKREIEQAAEQLDLAESVRKTMEGFVRINESTAREGNAGASGYPTR